MTDEPANLILEPLRLIRNGISTFKAENREQFQDIKTRLGSLEEHVASLRGDIALLHGDFSGQSVRLDRLEQ